MYNRASFNALPRHVAGLVTFSGYRRIAWYLYKEYLINGLSHYVRAISNRNAAPKSPPMTWHSLLNLFIMSRMIEIGRRRGGD